LELEPNETKQNFATNLSQQTTISSSSSFFSSSATKARISHLLPHNFSIKPKKPDPFKASKDQFISQVQEQLKRHREMEKKRNLMKQRKKIRHKKTQKAMQRSRKGQPIMKNYIENLLSKIEQENTTVRNEFESQNSSEFSEVSELK
jgi:hypothetical protein